MIVSLPASGRAGATILHISLQAQGGGATLGQELAELAYWGCTVVVGVPVCGGVVVAMLEP